MDPVWPPLDSPTWQAIVMNVEALYFLISGGAVMATFFCRRRWPVPTIVIQMFAWLFVGFAGIMSLVIRIFIPESQLIDDQTLLGSVFTSIVWAALIGASFAKYLDIRMWYRSGGHKK